MVLGTRGYQEHLNNNRAERGQKLHARRKTARTSRENCLQCRVCHKSCYHYWCSPHGSRCQGSVFLCTGERLSCCVRLDSKLSIIKCKKYPASQQHLLQPTNKLGNLTYWRAERWAVDCSIRAARQPRDSTSVRLQTRQCGCQLRARLASVDFDRRCFRADPLHAHCGLASSPAPSAHGQQHFYRSSTTPPSCICLGQLSRYVKQSFMSLATLAFAGELTSRRDKLLYLKHSRMSRGFGGAGEHCKALTQVKSLFRCPVNMRQ